jgi:hypothetical protein
MVNDDGNHERLDTYPHRRQTSWVGPSNPIFTGELTDRQPCQNRSSAAAAESGSGRYKVNFPLALLFTSAVIAVIG